MTRLRKRARVALVACAALSVAIAEGHALAGPEGLEPSDPATRPIPEPLTQPVKLAVGKGSILFQPDPGFISACKTFPEVIRMFGADFPPNAPVLDCFISRDVLQRLRHREHVPERVFYVVMAMSKSDDPVTRRRWNHEVADLVAEMPSVDGAAANGSSAKASATAGPDGDHVYSVTPRSVAFEAQVGPERDGSPRIALAEVFLANDRIVQVMEYVVYRSGKVDAVRQAAKARLDALVARTMALNPTDLVAVSPGAETKAYAACSGGGDPKVVATACKTTIDEGRLAKGDLADAYWYRARAWNDLKDYEKVIADLDVFLKLVPDSAGALVRRGEARRQRGDAEGAIADFERADRIGIEDRDRWALGNLGLLYEGRREWSRAEAMYGRIVVKDGKDSAALHQRCFVRTIIGKDLDGALADCDEAVKRSASNKKALAPSLRMRGFVHFRRKEYRAALADLDAAIAQDARFASALYLRGLVKKSLGDPSADGDIALAKAISKDIATTYASYGLAEDGAWVGDTGKNTPR